MPRGDRTGPAGAGPMTGRAMGYCTGNAGPGFANMAPGMGRGMALRYGWGHGGGFRRRSYYPDDFMGDLAPTRGEELQGLKSQAERLKRTLDEVQKRIDELEEEK